MRKPQTNSNRNIPIAPLCRPRAHSLLDRRGWSRCWSSSHLHRRPSLVVSDRDFLAFWRKRSHQTPREKREHSKSKTTHCRQKECRFQKRTKVINEGGSTQASLSRAGKVTVSSSVQRGFYTQSEYVPHPIFNWLFLFSQWRTVHKVPSRLGRKLN